MDYILPYFAFLNVLLAIYMLFFSLRIIFLFDMNFTLRILNYHIFHGMKRLT